MNEIKLLFIALSATLILQLAVVLISLIRNTKKRHELSIQFLKMFAIDHYSIYEKALCQSIQFTVALIFTGIYEILMYEWNKASNIYIAILCGISGIVLMKSFFLLALKITSSNKPFHHQLLYSHVAVFAAIAIKVYQN